MTIPPPNQTARVEAFSDGVYAIAITLLVLEIRVPPSVEHEWLGLRLAQMWPSFLAYFATFMTIGVMWLNHHRLFTLIHKCDDVLIVFNLLLLLGVTFTPFPNGLLAEHLRGEGSRVAGALYAGTFVYIAILFAMMWRYVVRAKLVLQHVDVAAITKQYSIGPFMYLILVALAFWSGLAVLIVSALYALYFAMPPRLWRRQRKS